MLTPAAPAPHYPPLTRAQPMHRPGRLRRRTQPIATRAADPGHAARHTLTDCPATVGSSPCLCIGRDR